MEKQQVGNAGNEIIKEGKENNTSKTININTANKEKLTEIPGIGEATALKIISYRNENRKI